MNDPETVRSVTTVGAVVLGFFLGQTSEWFKSRRKAEKQRKSVRRLVELETRNNISNIQNFWSAILDRKENWDAEDGTCLYTQLADEASCVPFPSLTTDAWRANLGEVAAVYTESELEAMWQLQRKLERILSLHRFFCEAKSGSRDAARFSHEVHGNSLIGAFVSRVGFSNSVAEPAKEFRALAESVSAFEVIEA